MSAPVDVLRIEDCSRGRDDSVPGYYIASGEGVTYRCYGWAANAALARKALAQVRRDLRDDPDATVATTARCVG
jgi:hypothetical protein